MWLFILASLLWLTGWVVMVAWYTSTKAGHDVVCTLKNVLPPFAITSCLAAFAANPYRSPTTHLMTLLAHHAAFCFLFLFLLGSEYLQMEIWWKIRNAAPRRSVAASYRRLWIMAELVPAP